MIIKNGSISVKITIDGGLDADGNPVKYEGGYGSPIPCNFRQLKSAIERSYEGNIYIASSYEILIEMQDFPKYGVVMLLDDDENFIGDFIFVLPKKLKAVSATQILV